MAGNRRFILNKKALSISIGILVIAIGILVGLIITTQRNNSEKVSQQTTTELPTFQTILPTGKSVQDVQGKMLRPPNSEPVFSYNDKINGKTINVTQQPLPESFKNDPTTKVAEMAKNFNATNQIEAGNTIVYIGTSAKGPQYAIFSKSDLLILIKSEEKIDDGAWTIYINSLI